MVLRNEKKKLLIIFDTINIFFLLQDDETPLHIACRQGSNTLVSLLLDHQADPNAENKVQFIYIPNFLALIKHF